MPILHTKLVMKSIEALHDEALALMPETASDRRAAAPPIVLRAASPPQKSPINALTTTSADAPPETASDHDIMSRIDLLLKKLNEDDAVTIAPQAKKGPQSKAGNKTSNFNNGGTDDARN